MLGGKELKLLPQDFEAVKAPFLDRVCEAAVMESCMVPPQLVLNFDQTNAKLFPVSEWTLARKGSKQVAITGKEDKQEITVLLTCTHSGILLPPQVIYAGHTPRCHPSVSFPGDWNTTHSDNHWSTEATMTEFLDSFLVPYVNETRKMMELPDDFPAVAIFDVFAAHRCQSFLQGLSSNNIKPVFIPDGCTGELQPLDISVNDALRKS